MKKVLLLGSNSQLAYDILKVHASQKYEFELLNYTRKDIDVTHQGKLESLLNNVFFDLLINCTAYNRVDDAENASHEAFSINTFTVKKIAEVCSKKKASFIHISTDYVFNGQNKAPYTENDPIGPLNVYGASKAMGEQLALLLNPQTYILRAASLFGVAGSSGKGGNFVETMIRFGKEKGVLNVVNDITMSPTSTAWIAQTILQIIQQKPDFGIYHTVNSEQATWYEFASKIIQKAKVNAVVKPVTSDEFPTLALRPTYSVLNNSKLKSIVGEIPSWESELEQYLKAKGHV